MQFIIINDSERQTNDLRHLLMTAGVGLVSMIEASHGDAALHLLRTRFGRHVDTAIIKAALPDTDLDALLATIRSGHPELRIVLICAAPSIDRIRHYRSLGVAHCLSEPIQAEDLAKALDSTPR